MTDTQIDELEGILWSQGIQAAVNYAVLTLGMTPKAAQEFVYSLI